MTAPQTDCSHPTDQVKVFFAASAGQWSAACLSCLARWVRTPTSEPEALPDTVRQAVLASAQMVNLTAEDLDRLGLTQPL